MKIPPKTILFPTDFSCRCDRPLERALRLARQWNAKLVLLHVLEEGHAKMSDADKRREELRIEQKLLAEVSDGGLEVDICTASGQVAGAVTEIALQVDADLIVTGVAHYSEFGDLMLGSTVDRLVRHSPAPVLVVKHRAQSDYKDIVVGTDFSACSAAALTTAALMFRDARLHLFHAYHVPYEELIGKEANQPEIRQQEADFMEAFLSREGLPLEARARLDTHLDYGDTCSVARLAVRASNADLAVIGTHGRSGFVSAMIGSVAEELLASLDCDVMVVRGTNRA